MKPAQTQTQPDPNPATKSAKLQRRRDSILRAATREFMSNGYARTSLTRIIEVSGGSMSTIYELFGDKKGLFGAVMRYIANEFKRDLQSRVSLESCGDLREFLTQFARRYLAMMFDERVIRFRKLIIAERIEGKSDIDTACFGASAETILTLLERAFGSERLAASFGGQNLRLLAERFCLLLEEPHMHKAMVSGEAPRFGEGELEGWIGECVSFFLRAATK